jgi:Protein of unknown function (DUF2867)
MVGRAVSQRLPETAHTSRPWRIHELTRDFRVEDVWALPTPGGPDDFRLLVEQMAFVDPEREGPLVVRALFSLRWKIGDVLGWDEDASGVGKRVPTLRERLPADLRETAVAEFESLPFDPLYQLDDEFAAEIANETMHGVIHLGWVPAEGGGYRGQMAVLVKPNGRFGDVYMTAIRPFRHVVVYPAMIRAMEREWPARRDRASAHA